MNEAKKAYNNYYNGLDGGIGGNSRFHWINNALLKDLSGKCVLDVGCGEGSLLKILQANNNTVFGIDVSEIGRDKCREKGIECHVIDISAEKFPYADDRFDVVLCLETLEHIENPHFCAYEIKRVLKEGGIFIASIPSPKIRHPYIYPGLFELKNFKRFLELCSFEIKEIRGWGQAAMFAGLSAWLKKQDNFLAECLERSIFYISRKRNLILRKRLKTPFSWSHLFNFICVNHKSDKNLVEKVAEGTLPEEAKNYAKYSRPSAL